ncbi:hypothetical protein CC_3014 [Caulobacter vibrioides CB15]|uniref:Uncharacterized protein n=1 Tax=Caulobacter vibrioides (strain ATCC 19089 / CIP 103742 / CB 15) TaxID=190650 RepID=Q9A429_CAUVC|nr:hypothetical protein CC_3014 [Caulobacter vibrioides CB15]ATC30704.1 hypothetical protein CA607_16225 [Caulobacter vibrioides]
MLSENTRSLGAFRPFLRSDAGACPSDRQTALPNRLAALPNSEAPLRHPMTERAGGDAARDAQQGG